MHKRVEYDSCYLKLIFSIFDI